MSLTASLGRIGGTLAAMVQTRLELAVVEMEEESRRFFGYLVLALLSLFLFGVAMLLVALLVIVVFWDTHRIAAVAGMAAVFGVAGAWVALRLKAGFAQKPPLLGHTLAELHKDVDALRGAGHAHEE